MYESTDKMVSHPGHYQSKTGLETIDVIEAFTDGLVGIEATDTGNIIKYACRWKQKNGIQDLEKILWYTQHLIDHLKKKEAKPMTIGDMIKNGVVPTKKQADLILETIKRRNEAKKELNKAKEELNGIYSLNAGGLCANELGFDEFNISETGIAYKGECLKEKEQKMLADLTPEERQEIHNVLSNSDVTILFDALAAVCGLSKIAEEVKKRCPELFTKEASNGSSSN